MSEKGLAFITLAVVVAVLVIEIKIATKLQGVSDITDKPVSEIKGILSRFGL
jgi:hypothetical protein